MASRSAHLLRRSAERLGFRVERIGPGCYVVRTPEARQEVRRLGDGRIGIHLVVDRRRADRHPGMVQKRLAEVLLREQVGWVVRDAGVDLVVDAGAHVGQYGQTLRAVGYQGRILSFEPVPAAFERLRRLAEPDPLWSVYPHALGAEDGEAVLHVTPGTLSSLRGASDFGRRWSRRLRSPSAQPVRVRRLDQVLDGLDLGDARIFLKLDTQGYDLEVFSGTSGVIDRVVGLQSEVAFLQVYDGTPRAYEQLAVYEAAGFEVAGLFPVSRHAPTLRLIEADVVMVRAAATRPPGARGPRRGQGPRGAGSD